VDGNDEDIVADGGNDCADDATIGCADGIVDDGAIPEMRVDEVDRCAA